MDRENCPNRQNLKYILRPVSVDHYSQTIFFQASKCLELKAFGLDAAADPPTPTRPRPHGARSFVVTWPFAIPPSLSRRTKRRRRSPYMASDIRTHAPARRSAARPTTTCGIRRGREEGADGIITPRSASRNANSHLSCSIHPLVFSRKRPAVCVPNLFLLEIGGMVC